jgi:hypothetical protein
MSHPQLGATVSGDAMMAGVAAAKLYRGVGQKAWPALEQGLELVTTIIVALHNYIVFLVLSGVGCHRSGWAAGRRLPSVIGQSCGNRI